ncbi:MAG: WxcM-like domain-containing protein [Muribaculaceae bacterium]|nr:WxcM-like domain-containing protein [Muribaculaceae bacterium]
MDEINVIEGEIFRDYRGQISSLNTFYFDGIRRAYIIHHPDASIIRGWHAHKNERKWFYCLKGSFTVALVRIDDWDSPSKDLIPEIFHLSDEKSQLVCVPAGYANCLKAHSPGSIMLVLSDKTIKEAKNDSWRYNNNLWVDWNNIVI